MLTSINDIVNLHVSSGKIEDALKKIHLDNKVLMLNIFTLRVKRGNASKEEVRRWNVLINNEIRKDRNLQKEIREYISVFKMFNKLGIKSGVVSKGEMPDFVLERNGKKIGIEVTKIYVGNDWVAEKLNEDIQSYRLRKNEIDGYIAYRKFQNKIKTYAVRGGIVIAPTYDEVSVNDYIIEIKNKLFEKIRKQIDDYNKYDENIIFAEIVTPKFFNTDEEIEKLSEEIKFYVAHLDGITDKNEYKLVLCNKDKWTQFDLKKGTYIQF